MQVYKSFSEGSTIFDIVLNTYMSLNAIPRFIADNGITDLGMITTAGQQFIFNTDAVEDEILSLDVLRNGYNFNTGKFFISKRKAENYLLIENKEILKTESNNLFLI